MNIMSFATPTMMQRRDERCSGDEKDVISFFTKFRVRNK